MVKLDFLTLSPRALTYVMEGAALREALTRMGGDDVSRSSIFKSKWFHNLSGIARLKDVQLPLSDSAPNFDVIVKNYSAARKAGQGTQEVENTSSFFDALEKFKDAGKLPIKRDGVFEYVLTAKGVARHWWARYVGVEELEVTLWRFLTPFQGERLERVCRGAPFAQRNPSGYFAALTESWDELKLYGLDKELVLERLQQLAELRNHLMYFSLDWGEQPVSAAV